MADEIVGLNPRDQRIIRELVDWWRGQPPAGPPITGSGYMPSSLLLVKTTSTVAARSGSAVSSGVCNVHQQVAGAVTQVFDSDSNPVQVEAFNWNEIELLDDTFYFVAEGDYRTYWFISEDYTCGETPQTGWAFPEDGQSYVGNSDGPAVPASGMSAKNAPGQHRRLRIIDAEDADFNNLQSGQVPVWDSNANAWQNQSPGGTLAILGGSPANFSLGTGNTDLINWQYGDAYGDMDGQFDQAAGRITIPYNGTWRLHAQVVGNQGNTNKEEVMRLRIRFANAGPDNGIYTVDNFQISDDKNSDRAMGATWTVPAMTGGTEIYLVMQASTGLGTFSFERATFEVELVSAEGSSN